MSIIMDTPPSIDLGSKCSICLSSAAMFPSSDRIQQKRNEANREFMILVE